MAIKVKSRQLLFGGPVHMFYYTSDGQEFEDLDEAIDAENAASAAKATKNVIAYEQVWSIQEAINKAAAENRVVRFVWTGDNASIKKGIVDKKGCSIMKPDRDSTDVAVIPPSVQDFDFHEVDTKVSTGG